MKKIIPFLFSAIALSTIVSCGSNADSSATKDANATDTVETPQKLSSVRVMMMGDIMMGSQCPWDNRYMTADDGKSLFDSVKPIIAQGDFIVGNLEGVLLDRTPQSQKMKNTFSAVNFMMPQRYAQYLVDAGFTAMAITNNHANDFHGMGVDSTIATLKRVKMPYSGVKKEAGYTIIEKNGLKYALCAFSTDRKSVV